MIKFLLRLLWCNHDWKTTDSVIEGVTLSWTGRPTRQYGFHYECVLCGKTKYKGGSYLPSDQKLHPDAYGEDGWPIDEDGNRLPIVDD